MHKHHRHKKSYRLPGTHLKVSNLNHLPDVLKFLATLTDDDCEREAGRMKYVVDNEWQSRSQAKVKESA